MAGLTYHHDRGECKRSVRISFFPSISLTAEARLDTLLNGSGSGVLIDADHRSFSGTGLLRSTGIRASEVYGTTYPWHAFYAGERPTLADLLIDGKIEQLPEWYKGGITKSKIMDGL